MLKYLVKLLSAFSGAYIKYGKKWYRSKTLWVNLVALICFLLQAQYGYVVDPAVQGAFLTLINLILRLITKEPITWGEGDEKDNQEDKGNDQPYS